MKRQFILNHIRELKWSHERIKEEKKSFVWECIPFVSLLSYPCSSFDKLLLSIDVVNFSPRNFHALQTYTNVSGCNLNKQDLLPWQQYLTIKWWQTTLAYFGCFDEECWLPLHVTETLKKREIIPVESHFLDMVEKSKPPAAAAKQETLPKRAGGNLLHYYFMVEANFPIFIPINDLSFLLYTRWFWYVVSVRPHIVLFVSS